MVSGNEDATAAVDPECGTGATEGSRVPVHVRGLWKIFWESEWSWGAQVEGAPLGVPRV